MKSERWQEIERLCHSALEIEPARRDAFLEKACAGDDSLRKEVGDLLAHKTEATEFMKAPAIHVAARVLARNQENLPASDLIGRTIGRYRIVKKIGEGGMGEVFLAEDTALHRKVALKFLPADLQQDPAARKRLLREARSAAALDHPFICHINEVGESEGRGFIAMEYVDGQMLSDRLQTGALPVREALQIASDVSEALEEAHNKGIIHRDLKPANIMITRKGHAKVMDFGLAKQLMARADSQEESITRSGTVLGTLAYMSPEQLRGEPVDARSDLFSFGVVLYEMLAGAHPFRKHAGLDTAAEILHSAPRPITEARRDIPAELSRVVLRMLAKAPDERYGSIRDVQVALRQVVVHREQESAKYRRLKTAGLVVVAGLMVLVAVIWTLRSLEPKRQLGDTEENLSLVPLTTNPGREIGPSFSPDGNQVVFWADWAKPGSADLYIKQIGSESVRRLTLHEAKWESAWGHNPAWSPDGQSIAYVLGSEDESALIMLIPPNGGKPRQVAEFRTVVGIGWHPGGRWLAVGGVKDSRDAPGAIYLFSPDTGEKRRLTSTGRRATSVTPEDRHPVFSPDGRTLAFIRAGEVYLLSVSAALLPEGDPRRLTYLDQLTEWLTWAPDGKEIVFASGSKPFDLILWRIATSGSGAPKPLSFSREGENSSPQISPKQNRLVYVRGSSDINIWRCPISGQEATSTLPSRLRHSTRVQETARYSPDGTAIAYVGWDSGRGEIWVCDNEGQEALRVTHLDGYAPGPPSWSPDGKDLVFARRAEELSEIYAISAQRGPMRQLTRAPFLGEYPSYSRDGRWIYFGSDAGGSAQVWKAPAAGGAAVPITRAGGSGPLMESLDGKMLFYMRTKEGDELWKVPVAGGEETRVLGGIYLGQFDLGRRGIYFASEPDRAGRVGADRNRADRFLFSFNFLPFAGGKAGQIAVIRDQVWYGFSVSPDERWILYTQGDFLPSDLMLVENFR